MARFDVMGAWQTHAGPRQQALLLTEGQTCLRQIAIAEVGQPGQDGAGQAVLLKAEPLEVGGRGGIRGPRSGRRVI